MNLRLRSRVCKFCWECGLCCGVYKECFLVGIEVGGARDVELWWWCCVELCCVCCVVLC